jgi:hypothetical protein
MESTLTPKEPAAQTGTHSQRGRATARVTPPQVCRLGRAVCCAAVSRGPRGRDPGSVKPAAARRVHRRGPVQVGPQRTLRATPAGRARCSATARARRRLEVGTSRRGRRAVNAPCCTSCSLAHAPPRPWHALGAGEPSKLLTWHARRRPFADPSCLVARAAALHRRLSGRQQEGGRSTQTKRTNPTGEPAATLSCNGNPGDGSPHGGGESRNCPPWNWE